MRFRAHLLLVAPLLLAAQPPQGAPSAAEATPPADEVARTVEAIARIRAAFSPSFSPDGRSMAYISNTSGSPQLWVMPLDGRGEPRQLTQLPDPVQPVYWSPNGQWLAYAVAPGGGLNTQIYVARPDGSGERRLTAGGRDNNWLTGWTEDNRLRIGSNEDNPSGVDAFLVDPVTARRTQVAAGGLNQILDVSRDGRFAVVYRLQSRGNDNLFLVDLRTRREKLLTPHEGPGSFGWGPF